MRSIASLVKSALLGFSALAGGAHALLKADPDVKTVPAVPNESLNYGQALYLASLFYEAQRSGKLPPTNRIPWRGDSGLTDGQDLGLDLSGGWYDAGDHLIFAFTQAWTVTTLAWGLLEFPDAYDSVGEYDQMLDTIKWPLDWLIKAHYKPDALVYQIGSWQDHTYWGPPELFPADMERPSLTINATNPGSDIAGQVAAAMAAASMVFAPKDATYAQELLLHATQLFEFGDKHRGIGSHEFYGSSGYKDELAWAATWLHKATGNADYLAKAERLFDGCCHKLQEFVKSDYNWDDQSSATALLLHRLTGKDVYKNDFVAYMQAWEKRPRTPKGLAFYSPWGSNRYTANTAFVALMAAEYGLNPAEYRTWAKKQIDYILTAGGEVNPETGKPKFSYLIGFGDDYPRAPHHRSSSCDGDKCDCSKNPHPHVLYGALVGGPGAKDDYVDDCADYQRNEVAIDYNAALVSSAAALRHLTLTNQQI